MPKRYTKSFAPSGLKFDHRFYSTGDLDRVIKAVGGLPAGIHPRRQSCHPKHGEPLSTWKYHDAEGRRIRPDVIFPGQIPPRRRTGPDALDLMTDIMFGPPNTSRIQNRR